MKKLLSIMLGLSLFAGAAAVFAQDTKTDDKTKSTSKKKKKKKTTDDTTKKS
jgi:uncharacterized protein YxeA